jgi:hypothetical protein
MANRATQYLRSSLDSALHLAIQGLMNGGPRLCGILDISMVLGTERSESVICAYAWMKFFFSLFISFFVLIFDC